MLVLNNVSQRLWRKSPRHWPNNVSNEIRLVSRLTPSLFSCLGHEPEANEHTQLLDEIQPHENGWSVSILYFDTQTPYTFYKKQLPATCRTSQVAQILANYAKSCARTKNCQHCTCKNQKDLCFN